MKKQIFVYAIQADNGEEYAEDRTEFTAGIVLSEEAAIEFVKTTDKIPAGCDSVYVECWNATANIEIKSLSFELERANKTEWKRYNRILKTVEIV